MSDTVSYEQCSRGDTAAASCSGPSRDAACMRLVLLALLFDAYLQPIK